ncbi:MAG: ACP S-malonyltransferase [Nitrospirota bacterium]
MAIAFVFPGQGSQYLGMGKALYNAYPEARAVFDTASGAAGFDIARLCFEGPEDELNRTEFTQPAILTVSLAAAAVLGVMNVKPDMVSGHSLGELTAVAAAGGLTVAEAASLARRRGRYMQEVTPIGSGLMAAVLGLEPEKIEEAVKMASATGVVAAANYNSPGQVVIAGERGAVEKASELCRDFGAKKVVPLSVSVPSHCPLMAPAAERLRDDLSEIKVKYLDVPLAANASGKFITGAGDVRESLVRQLTSPLLWEDCVKALIGAGAEVIIEVGPGKVLSGLVKRITKAAEIRNVEDETSLNTTLDYLAMGCKCRVR